MVGWAVPGGGCGDPLLPVAGSPPASEVTGAPGAELSEIGIRFFPPRGKSLAPFGPITRRKPLSSFFFFLKIWAPRSRPTNPRSDSFRKAAIASRVF
ncbi:hypothetical protein NL676_003858 [Syzygium grande]|nr:hypothetical protein NL676_003858 [Syzygium grande]